MITYNVIFLDSTRAKMKYFILSQSAAPCIVMSIKEHTTLFLALKQIAKHGIICLRRVLDFVFALTQNIFTFGFSHQKLANFAVPKWFLSLIDLD